MTDSENFRKYAKESIKTWIRFWLQALLYGHEDIARMYRDNAKRWIATWIREFIYDHPHLHTFLTLYLPFYGVVALIIILNQTIGYFTGFNPIMRFFAMLRYYQGKPANLFDLFFGFVAGGLLALFAAVLFATRENRRFRRDLHGGDGGPSGEVRLPMSRKVIDLQEFRERRHTPTEDKPRPTAQLD